MQPTVVMIAGPNGAGKSSIVPGLLDQALGIRIFVNADVIARGLSAFSPDDAAIAAGRIMLDRMEELALARSSFAFETTGASRSFATRITKLQATGYRLLLVFIWVPSPEISIRRVATRVALGGHHVSKQQFAAATG